MKGDFDKKVMDQVDHIITSDRRISDLVDIKNQKEVIKNYIKVQESFNKKDQYLDRHLNF